MIISLQSGGAPRMRSLLLARLLLLELLGHLLLVEPVRGVRRAPGPEGAW